MISPPLEAVGLDPATPTARAGGATGRLWRVETADGPLALRISLSDSELAGMTAAGKAGIPVPEVLRSATVPGGTVLLLSWVPGPTIIEALRRDPDNAEQLGNAVGATQRKLHEITAPPDIAEPGHWMAVPGIDLPPGGTLLHLDYHWLNVLVDNGAVTGVLDWENARRGAPVLDIARTYTLLNIEPTLETVSAEQREIARRFAGGWADGYGPEARDIPPWARAWAGSVMLANLAPRYTDNPHALDGLRAWITQWTQA